MRTKKGSYSLSQILQRYATKHGIQGKDDAEKERLAARKIAEEFVDRLLNEHMPVDEEKAQLREQIEAMQKENASLKEKANQQENTSVTSSMPGSSSGVQLPEKDTTPSEQNATGFAMIMAQLQSMQAQQTALQNQVNTMQSERGTPDTFTLDDLKPSEGNKLQGSIDSITNKKVHLSKLVTQQ